MPQISWPTTVLLVAVVMVSGALAALHVITADWIEHTLTGIIGFTVGHVLGILRGRNGSLRPPPSAEALRQSRPSLPPPPPR
jgi:hypothetical protein